MTLAEKKIYIDAVIVKMEKSQEREPSLHREKANDEVALNRINEMITGGENLPSNSGYGSLADWKKEIQKQILSKENSIKNLADERVEIEALKYFVANAV